MRRVSQRCCGAPPLQSVLYNEDPHSPLLVLNGGLRWGSSEVGGLRWGGGLVKLGG